MKEQYCFMTSYCIGCNKLICYNPTYVPSIRVKPSGSRQPLCRNCDNLWNKIHRMDKGLPPQKIHQEAYQPLNVKELEQKDK